MENGSRNTTTQPWTVQQVLEGAMKRFKKNIGGYLVLTILEIIAMFAGSLIGDLAIFIQFLLLPIWAGFFLVFKAENDQTSENAFGQFFGGFKQFGKYFSQGLMLFLFIFLPIGLLFALGVANEGIDPYSFQNPKKMGEVIESGVLTPYFIAGFVNMGVFMSIYIITYPIAIEFNLGAWKSMETSRKTFGRAPGKFIMLSIFIGSMLLISMMLLLIPLLILLPIIRCIQQEIFELSKEEISRMI